jgi:hypothetical protein
MAAINGPKSPEPARVPEILLDTTTTELPQAEIQPESKKGKMRLRLTTNYGEESKVSIAYKEISASGNSPISKFINRLLYKPVTVSIDGTERQVLMNIGSLSKRLQLERKDISRADQGCMRVFIQHHTFISSLAKNGIRADAAQKVAITIEQQLSGQIPREQTKAQTEKSHSLHYMEGSDSTRAYVSFSTKVLGKGGFGKVTKAVSFSTGAVVAHKAALDENRQQMLVDEGKRHLEFRDCPNVLQAHGVGDGGVMLELMNGGDFTNLDRVSDAKEMQQILYQALQGLAQLHAKGYVHRDVKPDNFLLNRNGKEVTVKLSDLGLIRKTGTDDKGGGTPTYISPDRLECIIGLKQAENNPKDDLFAFGISLCKILYGDSPSFSRKIEDLYHESKKTPATLTLEQKQKKLQEIRADIKAFYKKTPAEGTVDRLIYDLLQGNLTTATASAERINSLDIRDLQRVLTALALR